MSFHLPSFSQPASRRNSFAASQTNSCVPPGSASGSRTNTLAGTRRNSASRPSGPHAASASKGVGETDTDFAEHCIPTRYIEKNEKEELGIGRIVGGKYDTPEAEQTDADLGNIKKVDIDMPLTMTEIVTKNGKEYFVLNFSTGDKENPFNWNPWYKRSISTILNLMTLFIGLATTAYSSGIGSMTKEFGVSEFMGQLGLFTFNIACAIAPMVLAPFCELTGRKIVYAGAFFCFSLTFIGLALAKNIGTVIGLRLLLGLFGCVGTILVGGTFDDMYEPRHRGRPMAMFSFVAIFGTVSAPIYAGFIDQAIGWRWIEDIQGIANIPLFILIVFYFPETRGGVTMHKRAKQLRKATGDQRYSMLKASPVKAIHMLVTEPVVFAFGFWIAFCWAVAFMFLSVIPITFTEKRGWSEGMRKYNQLIDDPSIKVTPEARLYGAIYGAVFLPIGLFIYSFAQYQQLSWVGPVIGLAPIAFGIFFVFESTYSYTADCYGESASSAIAAQGFLRNTLGAVTPLFASAFFHNVGSQYAGLILALFGTALSLIPFVMFKYGHQLRKRSKLAKA
ncbi:amino acid transporter [Apiospora arundinis]